MTEQASILDLTRPIELHEELSIYGDPESYLRDYEPIGIARILASPSVPAEEHPTLCRSIQLLVARVIRDEGQDLEAYALAEKLFKFA